MPSSDLNILKLMGNKVNVSIITLLRRHPMSPRDLSKYLGKNEADVSRRLRMMERKGLVKSKWGTRLGKNVKLYHLLPNSVVINFQQDGLELEFEERKKSKHVEHIDSKLSDSPQETEILIGRDVELRLLSDEQFRFICIVGVAGMGKSSLARRFLQVTQASDNTFWHTFKEIDTLTYLIGKILAFLSRKGLHDVSKYVENATGAVNNEYESENLEIITDALNKIKCMIIFDDFHKVRDEKISIFLRYLQQHSMNKTLVLTRSKPPFYLDDIHSKELVLQGLPLEDSRKMISQLGFNANENAVVDLWKKFSGHPMTLRIFTLFAKAKHLSLNNNNQSVVSIDSINDYFQKEILEILSPDEQNILLTLSVFRTPVKSQAFKAININQRNLAYLLHSLEKKLIINRTASDKLLIHDMLRDILYPMLTYPEDAHSSAAEYYLSEGGAENVVESLYHFARSQDTEAILRILQDEVIDEKYRIIEDGYAAPLVEILGQFSLQNVSKDQHGYFYCVKGKALSMLHRWDEARENLEKTVKLCENTSDNRLLAYSLRNYGESLYLHGDLYGAEKRLLRAAEIFSKTNGTLRALRSTYVMLARLYFATGRPEESKTYSDMATSINL